MASLRDQLQDLYHHHGKLTPALVVDVARPVDHPLHPRFEWDDGIAGEEYRKVQARELIRSVRISYSRDDKAEPIRYFVSVERGGERAYYPAGEVAKDDILTEIVLREMERDWKELQSRYGHFREFIDLIRKELEQAA